MTRTHVLFDVFAGAVVNGGLIAGLIAALAIAPPGNAAKLSQACDAAHLAMAATGGNAVTADCRHSTGVTNITTQPLDLSALPHDAFGDHPTLRPGPIGATEL